jgi:FkbM family methyltransferase
MNVKHLLRKLIKPTATNRLRDNPNYCDCTNTVDTLLKHHKPSVLYDIGAHNGDWSQIILESIPNDIYIALFEPQKKHFRQLETLFKGKPGKHLFNTALGNSTGQGVIRGGGASASLLDANELQHTIFPNSFNTVETEEISIFTLDELIQMHALQLPDVIKIDVQGFELDVFKGATHALASAKYVIAELSFIDLYQKQPKLSELLQFLEMHNFRIIDFGHQWKNKQKEIIQVDAIFKKC